MSDSKSSNPMRDICIEKLVLNMSVGDDDNRLNRAMKVLRELTDQEPVCSKARFTIRSFGIRRNAKISTHVTVRGEKAEKIVQLGLRVHDRVLPPGAFSSTGNFGFGIKEHIDLDLKYDPAIGIFGMDFYVVLGRKGFRVSRRKHKRGRVGVQHKLTKDDAMKWVSQKFKVTYRNPIKY
ncbi:MAG: 60S ribosomal protein L11 [Cercozoa sp. M6MM]